MPSFKLTHVAVQVFGTHVVVSSVIPSLHHGPERLHAVCVSLSLNILANTVLNRNMVACDAPVGCCFISVELCIFCCVFEHEPL